MTEAGPGAKTDGSDARGADLAMGVVVLIWGFNFTVMKSALGGIDPFLFNALRFTLSVAFLGLLVLREPASQRPPAPRGTWLRVVGLGVIGHFLYQLGFIKGLSLTTSGNSSLLIATAPLWTALTARVMGTESLGRRALVGMATAFAGTACLAAAVSDGDGEDMLLGNILTVVGAAGWGIYTALNRPLLAWHSSTSLALRSMLCALPLLWMAALPNTSVDAIASLRPEHWGAILYSGLFSSGVAYALWNVGIRRIGSSRTAVWANAVPVLAVFFGWSILDEPVGAWQIGGGVLVVLGVWWTRSSASSS